MTTINPTFTAQTCTSCGVEFYVANFKRRIPVRERLTECRDCREGTATTDDDDGTTCKCGRKFTADDIDGGRCYDCGTMITALMNN